jgi:RNA polymerase-binding transcription factor DksA
MPAMSRPSAPAATVWSDPRARSCWTTAGGLASTGIATADVARRLRVARASEATRITTYERAAHCQPAERARAIAQCQLRIQEIDDALQRVDDGSYGVCHGCGHPIALARLETLPYTRYCERCG